MKHYSEFKQGNDLIRIPGKVTPKEYKQYVKFLRYNNSERDKCKFKAGMFSAEIGRDYPISKYIMIVSIPIGIYFGCKYLYSYAKQKRLSLPCNSGPKRLSNGNNQDIQDADFEEVREESVLQKEESTQTWLEKFSEENPMPELPDFLEKIISGTPKENAPAMLFHILSILGALCFSKVRAKYSDENFHAPNLQIIIEAPSGSGKGQFEHIYKGLFSYIIERDSRVILEKTKNSNGSTRISQTVGIGFSMSSLIDLLADNQGCHYYLFNSEIVSLFKDFQKVNGLNVDFLRKAFENGEIARNTKVKGAKNGFFKIFCNFTITGTPEDVEKTFGKQIEGGTNNRIAWCYIPPMGRTPKSLKMPVDDTLKKMQDQIRIWCKTYCFEEKNSKDEAVEEYRINLNYVCRDLQQWSNQQFQTGDIVRQQVRLRMATIAFHCAIVLHILWGEPEDSQTREKVVRLTRYLANHCMERYLHKFGARERDIIQNNREKEQVKNHITHSPQQQPSYEKIMSKEDEDRSLVTEMKRLYDEGLGQKKIAVAIYGSSDGQYVKKVKRSLEKTFPGQIVWGDKRGEVM